MAFSIKPHPKEGYYVVHGSDILEEVYLPFDAFVWDDQLGYWKHPRGPERVELFKYYALPNNFKVKVKKPMSDIQKQCWEYVTDWVKEDCAKEDAVFISKVNDLFKNQTEEQDAHK